MTTRTQDTQNNRGLLSRSYAINWEIVLFIVILALAIFTRFYALGDRVMSHDESLHTRFSYNLYNDGDFAHSPLMHGPILFHATAFFYAIFGDSDFSARIYTSIVGVLLVMSPFLFRRWLGRWGAILASVMILISPITMYYARYIRHDMPSIFSAVLMIWAMMMYVGGPDNQQRKARWLYVIAAAMLWNLGSKETAFIYIAIIGVFLVLFWLARLVQHFANVPGKPIFYTGMIGVFLGGVMSLGMYIVLDIVKFDMLRSTETTTFSALSTGDQSTFLLWTFVVIASVVAVLLSTLFWVYRNATNKINWAQVGVILVIALVVCMGFVVAEELSHTEPTSSDETAQPVDPETGEPISEPTSQISWTPMIGLWGLTIGGFAFLFFTRRKDEWNGVSDKDKYGRGFWGTMDLFPEFDLIIVIGSLILPWSTAIFPYAMKGTEGDFANIASSLPAFLTSAIGAYVPQIGAAGQMTQTQLAQVGQFWLSLLAFVPLFALMVGFGLMWNWKRWLIASAIFHGLFAFFFTTVFTNVAGLGTGWVYSLGYWLEQQGVRRGSQPQYYYLLLIMPFYEFLPVIGSISAMFAGTALFWKQNKNFSEQQSRLRAEHFLAENVADEEIVIDENNDTPDEVMIEEALVLEPETERLLIRQRYLEQILRNPMMYLFGAMVIIGTPLNFILDSTLLGVIFSFVALVGTTGIGLVSYATRKQVQSDAFKDKISPADTALRYKLNMLYRTQHLVGIPFLMFFSWLAILNLVGYSLAGEKMPWLGTHLTMPLIFLTAWYFGRIIEKIDWDTFKNRGWAVRVALIVFIIGLFRSVGGLMMGTRPFAGLAQHQLEATYGWLGAVIVTGIALSVIINYADTVGWKHFRQMVAVSVFIILSSITFRSAWLASFINYDYATEYLVYAHAAPGVKWVLEDIRELSERITDGNDLKFAYDNEVSWPYSWYFRDFDNVTYVGENPTMQNLEDAVVIVVGAANRSKVEPIVEDRYVRFDHMRLWWPMQDYFNLTPTRIYNTFDLSPANTEAAQIRQGIFDIWWNRDYTVYGAALERDFSVENWPVSDKMHFYVRKDFAAQIWEYGIGEGGVTNPLNEIDQNQCTANWQPMLAVQEFTAPGGLINPIGIDVAADGTLYVAEEFGHRISTFGADGSYLGSFGAEGQTFENGVAFTRPNSIDIGADGNLYIADTWNYRIQVLTPNLEPITMFGQAYTGGFESVQNPVDGFWGPREVAVSTDGMIYVADTGNKRVRAYRIVDGVAQFQYDVGSGGSGLGQLNEPSGLVVHPIDGRLFVADTWNRRISVFAPSGAFLDTYRVRGWYEEQGNRPYLALDVANDLLYVTDPDSGRVLVYTIGGECIGSFGQAAGSAPTRGQFGTASGVAVDDAGFVYVADSELGRILKFQTFPIPLDVVPVEDDTNGEVVNPPNDENVSVETTSEITVEMTEEAGSE